MFLTFDKDVSSLLLSSLRAIVICQKQCGNRVISSQIQVFAPLLNMRRCTLCVQDVIKILSIVASVCVCISLQGSSYTDV